MLSIEATNINFIVFGLTQTGLTPTMIYSTRDKDANHYTTNVKAWKIPNLYMGRSGVF
jgi:hypothetical protein